MAIVYKGDDGADEIMADPAPSGTEIYIHGFGGDDLLQLPPLAWGQVYGGEGDDTLGGGAQMATLYHGGAGADTIIVGESSGGASLHGGSGNDYLRNGQLSGVQRYFGAVLDGGAGDDTMVGSMRDEIFVVSSRRDVIEDMVANDSDRVRSSVSYRLGTALEDLVLEGFRDLNGTGNHLRNELMGNDGDNRLQGLAGNDSLDGGGGADTLIGGLGRDVLRSGMSSGDHDPVTVFAYGDVDESALGHGTDSIRQFDGNDLIDLSTIDADSSTIGIDDAFVFIGDASFDADATGQIRYETVNGYTILLLASIDADPDAELVIELRAPTHTLVPTDFVL